MYKNELSLVKNCIHKMRSQIIYIWNICKHRIWHWILRIFAWMVWFNGISTLEAYLMTDPVFIYICIFRQHFFVNPNFIKHNRHSMSTYFLLDPFEFPYYFYRIRGKLIYVLSIDSDTSSIAQHLKKYSFPATQLRKVLTDNTTILEHQNDKQKLQILKALHIRNLQPTLNRINFRTSANVLKCLQLLALIIELHLKANAIIFNGKDALTQ